MRNTTQLILLLLILCVVAMPLKAEPALEEGTNLKIKSKPIIPKSNMGLTFESPHHSLLGITRLVQTQISGDVWQVNWLGLNSVSYQKPNQTYPVQEVKTQKGILEGSHSGQKHTFHHPLLWPEGYVVLYDSMPVWIDAKYLQIKKKQSEKFSLGFLNASTLQGHNLDVSQLKELLVFRDLYQSYSQNQNRKSSVSWIKNFDKNFFSLKWIKDKNIDLDVNGQIQSLSCQVLGNPYFELTVLEDEANPLVLQMKFFPDQVPSAFYKSFVFFQKNFDFVITKIQF